MSTGRALSSGSILAIVLCGSTAVFVSLALCLTSLRRRRIGPPPGRLLRRNGSQATNKAPQTRRSLWDSLSDFRRKRKAGSLFQGDGEAGRLARGAGRGKAEAWPGQDLEAGDHRRPPDMAHAAIGPDIRGDYYSPGYPYQQSLPWISLSAPQALYLPPAPTAGSYYYHHPRAKSPRPGARPVSRGRKVSPGEPQGHQPSPPLRARTHLKSRSTDAELDAILESTARRLTTGNPSGGPRRWKSEPVGFKG